MERTTAGAFQNITTYLFKKNKYVVCSDSSAVLVLPLFPTPTHLLSFLFCSPLFQCFHHAFFSSFLSGPLEALKTLKEW